MDAIKFIEKDTIKEEVFKKLFLKFPYVIGISFRI